MLKVLSNDKVKEINNGALSGLFSERKSVSALESLKNEDIEKKGTPFSKLFSKMNTLSKDKFLYSVETNSNLLDPVTLQCIDYLNSFGYSRMFTHSITIFSYVLNLMKKNEAEGLVKSLIGIPPRIEKNLISPNNRQWILNNIVKNSSEKIKNQNLFLKKINSLFRSLDLPKSKITDQSIKNLKEFCEHTENVSQKKFKQDEDKFLTVEQAMILITYIVTYKHIVFMGTNAGLDEEAEGYEIEAGSLFMTISKIFNLKNFKLNDDNTILANLSFDFLNLAYSVISCISAILMNDFPYKEIANELESYSFVDSDMKESEHSNEDDYIRGIFNITIIKSINDVYKTLTGEDMSILGDKFIKLVDDFLAENEKRSVEETLMFTTFLNEKNAEIEGLVEELRSKEEEIKLLKLALSNKLKGKKCLVIGDHQRKEFYCEVIQRYGGTFDMLDPFETSGVQALKSIISKADVIFNFTAYNKHKIQSFIDNTGNEEVYEINRTGVKSLEDTILYGM